MLINLWADARGIIYMFNRAHTHARNVSFVPGTGSQGTHVPTPNRVEANPTINFPMPKTGREQTSDRTSPIGDIYRALRNGGFYSVDFPRGWVLCAVFVTENWSRPSENNFGTCIRRIAMVFPGTRSVFHVENKFSSVSRVYISDGGPQASQLPNCCDFQGYKLFINFLLLFLTLPNLAWRSVYFVIWSI